MSERRKSSKLRRRLLAAALVVAALVIVVPLSAWIAVRSVPSWHIPVQVSQNELSRVRNSLPNTYQELNSQIVKGEIFDFSLPARSVTEWTVAREELYPDARDWLPNWIKDPVVTFENDACIISAQVKYKEQEFIIGLHLVADITDEQVTIRATKLTAGVLPIPLSRLAAPLNRLVNERGVDVETMPDPIAGIVRSLRTGGPADLIRKGISRPNRFHTRNGKKSFKLQSASAANGTLNVRIVPL